MLLQKGFHSKSTFYPQTPRISDDACYHPFLRNTNVVKVNSLWIECTILRRREEILCLGGCSDGLKRCLFENRAPRNLTLRCHRRCARSGNSFLGRTLRVMGVRSWFVCNRRIRLRNLWWNLFVLEEYSLGEIAACQLSWISISTSISAGLLNENWRRNTFLNGFW